MNPAKNPVERCMDDLRAQWLEASTGSDTRLFVWRTSANAQRMLTAFFELQQQPGEWNTPDLFLRFTPAFETSYGYSRTLKDTLLMGYAEGRDNLRQQGVAHDWDGAFETRPDTATGFLGLLDSFAAHHGEHLRYAVAVLDPTRIAADDALEIWLEQALAAPVPPRIRLMLTDSITNPRWYKLAERYPALTQIIDSRLDMHDIARATAAQSSSGDSSTAYRQMLTDVMTLLERGSAAQTEARAERALRLAERQSWPDQQVALHLMVAGAYLKEQQFEPAIRRYRLAREAAIRAQEAEHPAAQELLLQTWFGEAGAWFTAKQLPHAAQAYVEGAHVAQQIPNTLFAIEGFRMAGYCFARAKQNEPAREHYLLGLAEARALAPAERELTTFPLLLQDLLRLQDPKRVERIERCAEEYKKAVTEARQQVECDARALGEAPTRIDLERIDAAMLDRCETAFAYCGETRETLIGGGDVFFRKLIAVGRDMLHPAWNGLPDVKHPTDKGLSEWKQPPSFTPLPSGDDLSTTPLLPATVEIPEAMEQHA